MEVGYTWTRAGFPDPSSHLLLESEGEARGVPGLGSREPLNVVGHLVRGERGSRLYFAVLEGGAVQGVVRGTWTGWQEV